MQEVARPHAVAWDHFLGDIWVNRDVNRKEDLLHSWAVIVPSFSGELSLQEERNLAVQIW